VRSNYHTSLKFLLAFHPGRRFVLTAIEPRKDSGTNKIVTATFDEARFTEAMVWLQKYGDLKYGLYFTVNPPDVDVASKPKKSDVPRGYYLHVDCDPTEGTDVETEQTRLIAKLNAFKPAPSGIVKSGNGVHGYWRLNEPADVATVEACNKVLEKQFTGGTQTWNVDRIMRLPGSVNYPNAVKLAKGRVEALSEVVELNLDRGYDIGEFSIVAPIVSKPPTKKDPDEDRSSLVFAQMKLMLKQGKTDEAIKVFFFDPNEKLSERFRERPDAMAFFEAELSRAKEKGGDNAIRAWKLEKNAEWPGGMTRDGDPIPNRANLVHGLKKHTVDVYFDEFAERTHLCGVRGFPEVCKLEDYPRNRIKLDIEDDFGPRWEEQRFNQMLEDLAHDRKRNPVLDYLDGLKWDGIRRLDSWLSSYCGAEENLYTRAIGRIHLVAGVRRVRNPGCKYDTMLIFISPQGFGKSTAVEILARESRWFAGDLNLNSDPKQLIENLHGKWIVECAEMKGNSKAEVSTVKGLLSRTHDIARMAYDHFSKEVPRKSIFFGSTNDRKFLYDPTGARRFWPVDVSTIDIPALRRDIDQLWAEAVAAEAAGEPIVLSQSLWEQAGIEQEKATLDNPIHERLETLLHGYEGKIMPEELWVALGFADSRGRGAQQNLWVAQTMQKLGWEKKVVSWQNTKIRAWAKGNTRIVLHFTQDGRGQWVVDETPDVFKPTSPPDRA
jgi:hypothetical protein